MELDICPKCKGELIINTIDVTDYYEYQGFNFSYSFIIDFTHCENCGYGERL